MDTDLDKEHSDPVVSVKPETNWRMIHLKN